jgi:hypothetical protein
MADARDRMERNVRVTTATAVLAVSVLLAASASAEGLGAETGLSLSTEGTGTAPAAPEKDTAGSGSSEELGPKDPANYEFAFVSVGAYQSWSIVDRKLFFGMGGGLGPPLYRYSKLGSKDAGWDPILEIAYANLFLRWAPVRYVDIDVGPKIALGSALFDVTDAPQSAFSYGGYVDLRVGTPTIKVGPRFEYDRIAYSNYYESGWRLTPLMLRVVH